MQGKYKVITLCGSTRFKETFLEVERLLSYKEYIVISVGIYQHTDKADKVLMTPKVKEMQDDMHICKIDMSDAIYVIDVDGYIGSSTKSQIEYAKACNKPVYYYSNRDLID